MEPKQALLNLYNAARQVNATAEVHEALKQSFEVVNNVLESQKED